MTELALAFPLLENDGEAATALQNPHGKVFHLPIDQFRYIKIHLGSEA